MPINHRIQKHIQRASDLRESGELRRSLDLLNDMIFLASQKDDSKLLASALSERALVYKHFFERTNKKPWLILMKKEAEAMLELADEHQLDELKAVARFRLGEVYRHSQDYRLAAKHYALALTLFKGPLSQKGDWRYHLGAAFYLSGKKRTGMREIFRGIDEIKAGKKSVGSFLYHVWLSGAYMQLADTLKSDHKKIAKGYWQMARQVINNDRRLVLRRQQLNRIKI